MTESAFPPHDLTGFLRLCAGEWLALRSSLTLEAPEPEDGSRSEGEEESWHRSERGELQMQYLDPQASGEPGGLEIRPPEGPSRRLHFSAGGTYSSEEASGTPGPGGQWQLWPNGSLELSQRDGQREIRERLWFTQPNLRLRTNVESRADGSPGR
ncbi:MAG: phycobiliprotein lyase, partial [Cyanobium sp.]